MLDRTRLVVERRLGTDAVDPNATFAEGAILRWTTAGWAVDNDHDSIAFMRGVAGLNKQTTLNGVVINEEVIVATQPAVANLAHANIQGGSGTTPSVTTVKVTSLDGLTTYTETTHYVINYTNGTLLRVAVGGAPAIGAHVLVSYTYQRTNTEIEEEVGMPLNNNLDETIGSNQVVVFQGRCLVATDQYDTSQAYTDGCALYSMGNGLLTSNLDTDGILLGYCKTAPTAGDPFLVADLSL